MVPGLFKEKITALIKGLPKGYRKQLVPVSRTAEIIAAEMEKKDEPLLTALARFIYRRFGLDIPASVWTSSAIPDHLKMRLSITDHRGRELQSGRDVHLLRQPVKLPSSGEKEPGLWNDARKKWEKSGIRSWNFGSLPEQISLGPHMAAYPCLEPGERCVNIRLCVSSEEADESHKKGVETLFCLHLSKDLKFLKRALVLPEELAERANYFEGRRAFEKALYDSLTHRLFHLNIRTEEAFHAHAEAVRPTLMAEAKELVSLAGKGLQPFHQTRSSLHDIETANRSDRAVLALCAEIRTDMDHLMPKNFLELYPLDRLAHLPRYLKTMEMRAKRGTNDVEKERRKAMEAEVFIKALKKMSADLSPHTSPEKREALEAFRWMVEEFKVSIFAQELKTPYPVSPKRLQEKAKEIERMV
jgi:ATP-dependent helicase HrpA